MNDDRKPSRQEAPPKLSKEQTKDLLLEFLNGMRDELKPEPRTVGRLARAKTGLVN